MAKKKSIETAEDGEWVYPRHKGFNIVCCDCGLVHRVNFKVTAGMVAFQAFRMPQVKPKKKAAKKRPSVESR